MAKHTIYVRPDDLDLWTRAEAFARVRRLSMSALILTALESYLRRDDSEPERPT